MRILMLLAKDVEARSRRAEEALTDAGHTVKVVCRKNVFPTAGGFPERFKHKATTPFPGNPIYLAAIKRAIRHFKPDVIHVHDLPLMWPAYVVSAGKIPLVFDMHENYPAMAETWTERSVFHRWLIRRGMYRAWEHWAVQVARHVLVVCEEQQQRVQSLSGAIPPVTVIGNTPSRAMIDALSHGADKVRRGEIVQAAHAKWKIPMDARVIFYSGILAEVRGVDDIIDAMVQLAPKHPEAIVVVAGNGPHLAHLQRRVRGHRLEEQVRLLGWQAQDDLITLTQRADICVIPHRPCEHINTTYPNKIFEYMAAGKPVIVSNAAPLARIVGESAKGPAGLVAKNVHGWVEAIEALLGDRGKRQTMGECGQWLVKEKYNAERENEKLLSVYTLL